MSLHSVNNIKESILDRNSLIAETLAKDSTNQYLHANEKFHIVNHCDEYSKIVPLVDSVVSNSSLTQITPKTAINLVSIKNFGRPMRV